MFVDFIYPIVKKILPWTLLLMCIALGIATITGAFTQDVTGQVGDSYLYIREINGVKFYEFKIQDYLNGLDFTDIFAVWAKQANKFKSIWENMGEHSDWSTTIKAIKSVGNIFIMIPNMLTNLVNMLVLLPLQLISQTLTILLRILGQAVNENSQFWIGKILYKINTWQGIPEIPYIGI